MSEEVKEVKIDNASDIKGTVEMVASFAQCIKVATLARDGFPSGELYARVMPYMTLEVFNEIITTLKNANLVAEVNNKLIWLEQ
ncbi:MAG TPA: hypothetical protein VIV60_30505 [Polyangiaceae bacterium]